MPTADHSARFSDGGFFFDRPKVSRYSRVNQGLPLALIRLYAVLSGKRLALPQAIGVPYTMQNGLIPNE